MEGHLRLVFLNGSRVKPEDIASSFFLFFGFSFLVLNVMWV